MKSIPQGALRKQGNPRLWAVGLGTSSQQPPRTLSSGNDNPGGVGCLREWRREHFVLRIGLLAWVTRGTLEAQGNTRVALPAGRVALGSAKAAKEMGRVTAARSSW